LRLSFSQPLTHEPRLASARAEILASIDAEVREISYMAERYQQTQSKPEFLANFDALRSTGERRSQQLEKHFGLKNC
jgi:hypothetical protein